MCALLGFPVKFVISVLAFTFSVVWELELTATGWTLIGAVPEAVFTHKSIKKWPNEALPGSWRLLNGSSRLLIITWPPDFGGIISSVRTVGHPSPKLSGVIDWIKTPSFAMSATPVTFIVSHCSFRFMSTTVPKVSVYNSVWVSQS